MNNTYSNKLMKNDTESSEYKNNDFEKQSIDHLIDPYFRNFDLKVCILAKYCVCRVFYTV